LKDCVVFASCACSLEEPATPQEAVSIRLVEWGSAVAEERNSHIENGTWSSVDELLSGKHAVRSNWVFKMKVNADGSLRYKARLVTWGFEQIHRIDYEETFTPGSKFVIVRVLLALPA
jgi:hypothetical protein